MANSTSIVIWIIFGIWALFILSCLWPLAVVILAIPLIPFIWAKKAFDRKFRPNRQPRRRRQVQSRRARRDEVAMRQVRAAVRRGWAIQEVGEIGEKGRLHAYLEMHALGMDGQAGLDVDLEQGDLGCSAQTGLRQKRPRRQHPNTNNANKLSSLPPELRLEIYAYLDYGSALSLQRTSRFFHNDLPHESVDREQRATYVYHAETFPQNKDRLACYGCLRLVPTAKFTKEKRSEQYARFGTLETERICSKCEIGTTPWLWRKLRGWVTPAVLRWKVPSIPRLQFWRR